LAQRASWRGGELATDNSRLPLYNSRVLRIAAASVFAMCFAVCLCAQEQPSAAQQPNVHVNYLNVCSPSEAEQKEIAGALRSIPPQPSFATDFEVARGRSTMAEQPSDPDARTLVTQAPVSDWVRIRHEFAPTAVFSNAQYSFSLDEKGMAETLVLRSRDAGKSGVLQISIQDSVSSGTPEALLASDTPADRIRVERSGKASLVLARCPGADQAQFQPLFRTASEILMKYRAALNVRQTVPGDLARLRGVRQSQKKSVATPKP
jgi:hypothetical protein